MPKQFVTTVNEKLNRIYIATSKAKEAGVTVHSNIVENYLHCNIDKTNHVKINLFSPSVFTRLDSLLVSLNAILSTNSKSQ
jgi:hypothetical protein